MNKYAVDGKKMRTFVREVDAYINQLDDLIRRIEINNRGAGEVILAGLLDVQEVIKLIEQIENSIKIVLGEDYERAKKC